MVKRNWRFRRTHKWNFVFILSRVPRVNSICVVFGLIRFDNLFEPQGVKLTRADINQFWEIDLILAALNAEKVGPPKRLSADLSASTLHHFTPTTFIRHACIRLNRDVQRLPQARGTPSNASNSGTSVERIRDVSSYELILLMHACFRNVSTYYPMQIHPDVNAIAIV